MVVIEEEFVIYESLVGIKLLVLVVWVLMLVMVSVSREEMMVAGESGGVSGGGGGDDEVGVLVVDVCGGRGGCGEVLQLRVKHGIDGGGGQRAECRGCTRMFLRLAQCTPTPTSSTTCSTTSTASATGSTSSLLGTHEFVVRRDRDHQRAQLWPAREALAELLEHRFRHVLSQEGVLCFQTCD